MKAKKLNILGYVQELLLRRYEALRDSRASSSAERLRCSRDSGWTQVPASEAGSCLLPRQPGKPLVRIRMTSGPSGYYRPPSSASVVGSPVSAGCPLVRSTRPNRKRSF
jgi:hypothetical protein